MFGTITQNFIKDFITRRNTCVLASVMFYETRHKNTTKYFRELSCVIYTIIDNYVCINYLDFQPKTLSVICMDRKYFDKSFNKLLGIGIPDLLMNLLLCHGSMKNTNSTVISLCTSRMLEYYFSKRLVMLELNSNNLMRIANEAKQRINEMYIHDSYYVINCNSAVNSILNTLMKLLLHSDLNSYYIKSIYNSNEEITNNIFSTYVEHLLNDINNTALVQE